MQWETDPGLFAAPQTAFGPHRSRKSDFRERRIVRASLGSDLPESYRKYKSVDKRSFAERQGRVRTNIPCLAEGQEEPASDCRLVAWSERINKRPRAARANKAPLVSEVHRRPRFTRW